MKHQVLGALRPTVGNTIGLTTQFSGRYPINMATGASSMWPYPYPSGGDRFTFDPKVVLGRH